MNLNIRYNTDQGFERFLDKVSREAMMEYFNGRNRTTREWAEDIYRANITHIVH